MRHHDAYEALRRELDALPGAETVAGRTVLGTVGTVGQVASHMIASEAVATKRVTERILMDARKEAMRRKGERADLIDLIGRLIEDVAQPATARIVVCDKPFRAISSEFVQSGGTTVRLSRTLPGVHRELPAVGWDHHADQVQLRRIARARGVDPVSAARATFTPNADGTATLTIPSPNEDPALDLVAVIRDAAHHVPAWYEQSFDHYARKAAARDADFELMVEEIADHHGRVEERLAREDGVTHLGTRLHTCATRLTQSMGLPGSLAVPHADRTRKADYVYHHDIVVTGPMLRPLRQLVVTRSGDKGATESLERIVSRHRKRQAAIRKGATVRYETVARRLLEARGADMDELEASLNEGKTTLDGSAYKVHADCGLITLRHRLSPTVVWNRDRLELSGTSLPSDVALGLAGEMMTALVDHPALAGVRMRSVRTAGAGIVANAVVEAAAR